MFLIPFKATAKFPPERFPQAEEKGPGGIQQQQQQQQTGPKKVVLNSSDELFYDIRDLNFSAVGIHLSRKAKQISAAFEVGIKINILHTCFLYVFVTFLWENNNNVLFSSY